MDSKIENLNDRRAGLRRAIIKKKIEKKRRKERNPLGK